MKRYAALKESDIRKECAPTVNDPQNKALAGVGTDETTALAWVNIELA